MSAASGRGPLYPIRLGNPLAPSAHKPSPRRPGAVVHDWRDGRATDFSQLNILVVDEDPLHRMLMRSALDFLGVGRITETSDGHAGLSMLEHSERVFDIVISDLKKTAMDDIEFMRRAPRDKMASLILVSGRGLAVLVPAAAVCRGYGINVRGVLAKPLALPQLKLLLSR